MSASFRIIALSNLLVLAVCQPAAADHPLPLPNVWTTPGVGYNVRYTSQNPYDCNLPNPVVDDLNYISDDDALDMAQALDSGGAGSPGNPPGYHFGYTNLGFLAPDFDGNEPPGSGPFNFGQVWVYNCAPGGVHDDDDCDNGSAPADLILMPATVYCGGSERNIRRVMGHELMHHVQFGYIGFGHWEDWGRTAVEGNARMMEDMIYSDIDGDSTLSFWGEVKNYLDNPNRDWWRRSYQGALGWKYAAERYGTVTDEPQYGVDFVRRFWENAQDATDDDNIDFATTFKNTIRETSPGTTLAEWFQDFSIANIAKEFDASLLPDGEKYRYIDETDGNGVTLPNVKRTWVGNLPGFVLGQTELARWGSTYMEANLTDACSTRSIAGWRTEGDYKAYAVMTVDGTGRITRLVRGAGENNTVSFIQRGGSERHAKLIAILTGRSDYGDVTWQFDCGVGNLQVNRPDTNYQAYVGPPEEPRTFIVRMTVTGPAALGDPTVLGLQPGDFEVYVGSNYVFADEAVVVTGLQVQGEYWLVVRAPEKPNTATYDLHVNFGSSLFRTVPGAVSYEERLFDQVLTLDTSGSMAAPAASPSIEAAVNAASLFTDVARDDDRIGLVTFAGDDSEPNNDAVLQAILDDATVAHRETVKNKLALLSPSGLTSIGDGMDLAADEFPIHGSVLGEDWIVLLSDGMENESLYWDNVSAGIQSAGIRVNAIALGPDADQVLLQAIAEETEGDYYYVDTGTLRRAGPGGSTLPNRLADIYAANSERITDHERLWEFSGSVASPDTVTHQVFVEEGGIVDATLSVNWDKAADDAVVTIRRPNDSIVVDGVDGARIYAGETHVSAHLGSLSPGTWTVEVAAGSGAPDYIGILAGRDRQGASLELFFTQFQNDPLAQSVGARFLRGLEQPILAMLIDNAGTVGGASVRAEVEHPDGSLIDLPLFDDGEHGDGSPGDGVYGNHYTRTTVAGLTDQPDQPGNGVRGSYNVVLRAEGVNNSGNGFKRIRKGSFSVFESFDPLPDTDGDELPDRYENLHPCMDALDHDSKGDSDQDRLSNREEWELGTDPCHPDTDRGGESDFSELLRGANNFDAADDALPRPVDVEVVDWRLEHLRFSSAGPQPSANWIRYPVNPAYSRIHVLRSNNANGIFNEVAVFDARAQGGTWYDEGLVNGQAYFYRIQPDDLNGNLGTPSHVFSGTPKSDPLPPIGSVRINGGAAATTSTAVTLNLTASMDTVEMRIANGPDFGGQPWLAYDVEQAWVVAPAVDGQADVYVKLRDAALNESTVYSDSIEVVSAADVGAITGVAKRNPGETAEAIQAKIVDGGNTGSVFTNVDGLFNIAALAPGTYDLRLSYPGYQSEILTGIVVNAGAVTDAGTTILQGIDSDADGVLDVADNCSEVANADQRDTNDDGFGNICDADLNNDCAVNFGDLGIIKDVFFLADDDADLNGDGVVNFTDLGLMKAGFFAPPGPSGVPNDCL